jgi:PmbA protein
MDLEFAQRLIAAALQKGAAEAEVYLRSSKHLGIEVRNRKVDTLESSATSGYGLRVIRDHRPGFSYSTDPADRERVAENAVEASRYTERDEFSGLPLPSSAAAAEVAVYDNAIASMAEEEAIEKVLSIEKSALATDSRVRKIRKASGTFLRSETCIANSRGISFTYSSTGCSASIMAVAEENGGAQIGWDYSGSRFLSGVSFEEVGRGAARKALSLLGARKITPVRGSVILDSSVVADFLGLLASALSSEAVQKKKSMLAGKTGEQVITSRINIVDDGLLEGRPGSRPVDDEGIPTTRKVLIERGSLRTFLYNTYTARKEGAVSGGNAVRGGFAGLPTVGPTNLYLEPSERDYMTSFGGLLEQMDSGLYVIETMGMHTANRISGEFSIGVSGVWVEKGKPLYPVKEAAISGNVLTLFNNIRRIGDDLRFYGNIGAASLLIESIDISG